MSDQAKLTVPEAEQRFATFFEGGVEALGHLDARVTREPRTYEEDGEYSYFRDHFTVLRDQDRDSEAAARLASHGNEMRTEYAAKHKEYRAGGPEGVRFEGRANPNTQLGTGGEFTPPLWLIEKFATARRAERVLADLVDHYTIPSAPGFSSIHLPRLTVGTNADTQQDNSPVDGGDIETASVESSVATISGESSPSLQLLEQSPLRGAHLDQILFKDLLGAYDAALESEMTVGTGKGESLLGVLNDPTRGKIATTESAGTKLYKPLGEAFGYVSKNRKIFPEVWIMRGGKWAWLGVAPDKQELPFNPPLDIQPPNPPQEVVGSILGIQVRPSESIPENLNGNQDAIICTRPSDMILWESPQITNLYLEPGSGTLQAKLILRGYAAFIGNRYDGASTATVEGAGCKIEGANF